MNGRFKLEAVLGHRKHLEETAQMAFSESSRKWEQARKALEVMERKQRKYQQDLKSKMQNDGAADELFLYHRYLGRLGKEIRSQAGLANELEAEKEEKRAQLLVALKNRKIIERLKERYLETEARKTRDQEQKLLNEVAANRYLAGRVNPCG